jgi:hypothetical protein
MQQDELNFGGFHWDRQYKVAAVAIFIFVAGLLPEAVVAQQQGQKTFSSAEEACKALVTAAQNNNTDAMTEILGPDAKQIISSGDKTEDAQNRAEFVQRFQEMHRFVKEPDGTTTLYAGAENWPMPIPLVNKGKSWYFDSAAGKREIVYRRVGRNEISTIRVCQELVAAEKEYYSTHQNEYAQKFFSDEGQQNGLYWKVPGGQQESPIGPLVASAIAEGYMPTQGGSPSTPYRGYFYRVLDRQGASAPGGANSYVVDGKMTGGFAFVAYPAEYRSSGVMTFIVGMDGVVYRKDLGANTATLAKAMKSYVPDSTWKKDEDQQEETAAAEKTN